MKPIGEPAPVACWHCSRPVAFSEEAQAARYLYRGDQPLTVLVEDWLRCECGAFQNLRRLNQIVVESLGKS